MVSVVGCAFAHPATFLAVGMRFLNGPLIKFHGINVGGVLQKKKKKSNILVNKKASGIFILTKYGRYQETY